MKEKQLMKKMKFDAILGTKVDLSKVNPTQRRPS